MKIAYSCNDAYIEQTGISMISVMENNRDEDVITFYLISKDISDSNILILKDICERYGRQLIVVDFNSICYDLNISNTGRHIETIYSKVFFSRIEGLDKIIYLDSDTVVVGSLAGLWNTSLDGYYMGVVQTVTTKPMEALHLPPGTPLFNDGMAFVNVDYCRENHLIEKVLSVVDEFNGNPPVLSEGALNKVCQGKILYISPRYNLMAGLLYLCLLDANYTSKIMVYTEEELKDSCEHPVVIHYLSVFYNRPWFKKCTHPYKEEYYRYKSLSPWKDSPLKEGDLPTKLKIIDKCYRLFGVKNIETIRRILKRN